MHPNPVFRGESSQRDIAFVRERGFGVLTINGTHGPLAAHVPIVLQEDGTSAELHLMRSNPISRALRDGPKPALMAITGPDGYISPDWYGVDDQVPTWNYVAVHLRGVLHPLPEKELREVLERLSQHFEQVLAPKTPWTSDKMTPGVMDRMMRAILPFRLEVKGIASTWKLNQNKSPEARHRAAAHVAAYPIGSEAALLAGLMQGLQNDA